MKILFLFFGFCLIQSNLLSQVIEESSGIYNFIENKGQWPDKVLFKADVNGGNIWLEKTSILYQFQDNGHQHHGDLNSNIDADKKTKQHLVKVSFVGANNNALTKSYFPSDNYYNYYLGNDKSKWTSENRSYNKIVYEDLYSGIDLSFYEKDSELKYEYILLPGAEHNKIRLHYAGQANLKLQKNGNLNIFTSLGQIIEQKPYAYQIKNGKIIEVKCEFVLSNENILSYRVGDYDNKLKLIIDPVLVFATYNGATSDNFGMTATYAYDGKAYTGGIVFGNAYPTPALAYDTQTNFSGANSGQYGISDVFITKYNEDGSNMLWTTFIGGGDDNNGTETVHSLICDKNNNVYLYGATSSIDFPIQNGFQAVHGGGVSGSNFFFNGIYFTNQGTDIYVAKFSEDGMNLLGSTFIGGSGNDGINYKITSGIYDKAIDYDSLTTNYGDQFRGEIMLDSMNNILVASSTRSSDFPINNSFQNTIGGQQDGVLFKISSNFSSLMWSTFYGGDENDACYSVKIDSSYNILIAGGTSSTNLANTSSAINPNYQGGKTDGFVAKISPDGSSLIRTTYIGTSNYDQTIFVEIDRWDNVFIVGVTEGNFPIFNAPYSNPNSGQYIMKLNPDLTSVTYSTVFGDGSGVPNISPAAFLVDVCGNVYVSGWGGSILPGGIPIKSMPVSPNAYQGSSVDGFDFYLFVMERNAKSLLYASYLGDSLADEHVDGGTSRFDKFGIVYQSVCGGCGGSDSFPTTPGAWSNKNGSSNCNNVLFKFNFEIIPEANFTVNTFQECVPFRVQFNNISTDVLNSSWNFDSGVKIIQGGPNPIVEFTEPGDYTVTLDLVDSICGLSSTHSEIITAIPSVKLEVSNDTIICDDNVKPIQLIANSFGSADNFIWADNINFLNPINQGGLDSTITITPGEISTYYVKVTRIGAPCDSIRKVTVLLTSSALDLQANRSICKGDTTRIRTYGPTGAILIWEDDPTIVSRTQNDKIIFVSPLLSQYYYVSSKYNECLIEDSIWIEVSELDQDLISANASPIKIAKGSTSELIAKPNGGYIYHWEPNELVENPNQSITSTLPLDNSTEFEVSIINGACKGEAKVNIEIVEFTCGEPFVFVPNAFSPNNDNFNDKVFVRGQYIEELRFMVFDRWGELVFETNDQGIGWDGTFKSELMAPDVYVYHLKVKCVNGQENLIKGNITLLK